MRSDTENVCVRGSGTQSVYTAQIARQIQGYIVCDIDQPMAISLS